MIRLSITSKLDGVRSWSLEALETCPGSKAKGGGLVDACKGCYAVGGNYRFANVKAPRAENKLDWQESDWVERMVAALANDRYFRWFDSGDMYALALAEKILAVMRATPHCRHWLPTRMGKFPKFGKVLTAMRRLPNVSVRFSSDSVEGGFDSRHGSTIIPDGENPPAGVTVCHAYANAGKCGSCRACYDKTVPVIAYVAHGQTMAKVIRLKLAA